jgi:hypothetical protein
LLISGGLGVGAGVVLFVDPGAAGALDGAVSFCVTRWRSDGSSRWAKPELTHAANVRAVKVTTEMRLICAAQAIGAIVGMFDLHSSEVL